MKNRWSNYNLTTILYYFVGATLLGVELFSGQGTPLWFGRAICETETVCLLNSN
jgi:hypothetical protein